MSIRKTEKIAGVLVAEDHRLPWYAWQYDKATRVCVTGEVGAVRWELVRHAFRLAVQLDMQKALEGFAHRVGIEYSDISTDRADPDSEADNPHTGGNSWQ